jgi:hypothetical protein
MKDSFPGYYRPTESEFAEMWESCLFVLDANVLLNLYRYSVDTREELLAILQGISDRLWVPHQAALEYQQRRLLVIGQQAAAYEDIRNLLANCRKRLENDLRSSVSRGRHPFIDADRLLDRITTVFGEIEDDLEELSQAHPDLVAEDPVRETLTALLNGRVGPPYSTERLSEIYGKGKARYDEEIPPGYRDTDKGDARRYGDLVLWFQTIDKAKESNQPILLVTDDRKDDWWLKFKGRTIGPRPELVNEMVSEADVSFYMYSADPFMEHASKYLERQVNQRAIEEVREIRRRDEKHVEIAHLDRSVLFPYGALDAMRAAAAIRLPQETLDAMRAAAAIRLPQEMLDAMRAAAAIRLPQETLDAMRAAAAIRLPQETLDAMRAAAAIRLPQETLDAMRAAAAIRFPQEMLDAMRAAAAIRLPQETLDAIRAVTELGYGTSEAREEHGNKGEAQEEESDEQVDE